MREAYALVLWKMLEGGMKPEAAVAHLRENLARHGRSGLLSTIGKAFERLASKKMATDEAQLFVAHEKDASRAVKEAVSLLNLEDGDMRVCVDATLIGGWRLQEKNRLVDASFKNHLLSIYNRATQS